MILFSIGRKGDILLSRVFDNIIESVVDDKMEINIESGGNDGHSNVLRDGHRL